jgi:hypothetical protein
VVEYQVASDHVAASEGVLFVTTTSVLVG